MVYKGRGNVENQFNTYKNVLNADRMYLQDDDSVFGHLFTSFLALYIGMTTASSKKEFSKVYILTDGDREIISEIPGKVAELDKRLGMNVFPEVKS